MKTNLIKLILYSVVLGSVGSVQAKDPPATQPRPVPTATVQAYSSSHVRKFPGEVRAFRRVELAFNVSGQLEYLSAMEGSEVNQGDLIARLDARDYQYALDAAGADFIQAESTYQRKKKLYETKVISSAEFDQTTASYLTAKARLDRAQKAFDDTSLFAPFNAVIAKRHIGKPRAGKCQSHGSFSTGYQRNRSNHPGTGKTYCNRKQGKSSLNTGHL